MGELTVTKSKNLFEKDLISKSIWLGYLKLHTDMMGLG